MKSPLKITRRLSYAFVSTILCGLFVGCGGLVSDPNFHTWCGDQLCSWKLESGKIQRAPTWHPDDFGVELLDSTDATHTTEISQHIDANPKCLEFSTVADVASGAQVSVGVDFDDDGTVEYESPIAATGFTEQKTQITAPAGYRGLKLFIIKRGTGRAVLAQLNVVDADDCTAAPVKLMKQVLGTVCAPQNGGDECTSGVCCLGVCSECCGTNVAACGSGPDGGADGGEAPTCKTTPAFNGPSLSFDSAVPSQCDPAQHLREPGKDCLLDADCKSSKCVGAVWNLTNVRVDGGVCSPPPNFSEDCAVDSVRTGTCE